MNSKLIMIYGRMNPIHSGHAEMLIQTKRRAYSENADFRVYLTKTQDSARNPLKFQDKLRFLRMIVGVTPTDEFRSTSNIFDLIGELSKDYSEIECVFGGDQYSVFDQLMKKYEHEFSCPVTCTNFAERHRYPISSTEMRRMARSGDYQGFMDNCPSIFTRTQKLQLFTLTTLGLTNTVRTAKYGNRRTRSNPESEE